MKSISLVASMAVMLGVGVAGACSSKDKASDSTGGSSNNNSAGSGNAGAPTSAGGEATTGAGGGQDGGAPAMGAAGAAGAGDNLPPAPEAILCPEKNAISPKIW